MVRLLLSCWDVFSTGFHLVSSLMWLRVFDRRVEELVVNAGWDVYAMEGCEAVNVGSSFVSVFGDLGGSNVAERSTLLYSFAILESSGWVWILIGWI